MKHLELFESWHNATTCSHCKGTGMVGQSKKQSIESILRNSTTEHFMEFLDDEDFVENAVDLFKERGVFSLRVAEMVASLKLSREDIEDIIEITEEGFDDMEGILDSLGDGTKGVGEKELKKMKDTIRDKARILSTLRGR
jgi:hypothetical protein